MVKRAGSIGLLAVLGCCLVVAGCRAGAGPGSSGDDQSAEISRLKADLSSHKRQLADLKEEFEAVRSGRDDLQASVEQLSQERDSAISAAEQSLEIVRQVAGQTDGQTLQLSSLQEQIKEYEEVVTDQAETIAELEKTISDLQNVISQNAAVENDQQNEMQEENPIPEEESEPQEHL